MEDPNEGAEAKGTGKADADVPRSSASLPLGGAAVVVGGGVAGTAAAAELCSRRPDARVTLVARDDKVKVRKREKGLGRREGDKGGRERERKRELTPLLDEKKPEIGKSKKTKKNENRIPCRSPPTSCATPSTSRPLTVSRSFPC
jgi:hypothetical protein